MRFYISWDSNINVNRSVNFPFFTVLFAVNRGLHFFWFSPYLERESAHRVPVGRMRPSGMTSSVAHPAPDPHRTGFPACQREVRGGGSGWTHRSLRLIAVVYVWGGGCLSSFSTYRDPFLCTLFNHARHNNRPPIPPSSDAPSYTCKHPPMSGCLGLSHVTYFPVFHSFLLLRKQRGGRHRRECKGEGTNVSPGLFSPRSWAQSEIAK